MTENQEKMRPPLGSGMVFWLASVAVAVAALFDPRDARGGALWLWGLAALCLSMAGDWLARREQGRDRPITASTSGLTGLFSIAALIRVIVVVLFILVFVRAYLR